MNTIKPKTPLPPSAPSQYPNLGKAVLHVAESGTRTDGFPTGDTEDPLDAVCENFSVLHGRVEEPVKQCGEGMGRERYQVPSHSVLPISTHLLILADSLLLATYNDGLKFMVLTVQVLQVGVNILLLMDDVLKHFLAMLLSNAGAILPLLEALGHDIVDASGRGK